MCFSMYSQRTNMNINKQGCKHVPTYEPQVNKYHDGSGTNLTHLIPKAQFVQTTIGKLSSKNILGGVMDVRLRFCICALEDS